MRTTLLGWFGQWQRRHRERALVSQLLRLNDHLLSDIGVRREQLQPDGIHELDLPSRPRPTVQPRAERRGVAIRPSLQGCG